MTRHPAITPEAIGEAERLLGEGLDPDAVARRLGLSAYVVRVLADRQRLAEASADPRGGG